MYLLWSFLLPAMHPAGRASSNRQGLDLHRYAVTRTMAGRRQQGHHEAVPGHV